MALIGNGRNQLWSGKPECVERWDPLPAWKCFLRAPAFLWADGADTWSAL